MQEEEHQTLTQGAGLVDFSHRTHLELQGADRTVFLHNFCTNEIKLLQQGEGCEAFLLNPQGKVIGLVAIFCGPESLWIETVAGQGPTLHGHLDRYIIREDVEVHDRTAERREWLLAGANAPELLAAVTAAPVPETGHAHQDALIAGVPVSVRRVKWTPAPTFLVAMPADDFTAVGDGLRAAGARDCSLASYDRIRIEAGMPEFGRDVTVANLPQEVDRDDTAINFRKGCYLGQETVARIDALGHVNWRFTPLLLQADTAPTELLEFTLDGKVVGRMTSAAWSPERNSVIGLGYVRTAQAKPGAKFDSPAGPIQVGFDV
ncbi:CAF17-like 4Fe-4S cluster assembly/insertion protein YgfZ [Lignipirellula cremea]|uniref:Aminomethyltransferase n=1 Tax=Lignipirellula cremea TaxID=2528010 RepID=A0A518E0V8_9BACT|nr:glycine cleavage T C-terminal barrel domain-containing protein [Lignipirellula cremea]QDU97701.1 Aminomethyltransferase [Lignipirellula cremea]